MGKTKTKFSVVIPTRERCDVLESALRTCIVQDYDELEIIVSDNNSRDETREVVESFRDSRVRYINTGKSVSMTHNWEFAFSHIDGGYVIYVGDDDGLLPGALTEIDEIINATGTEALSWRYADYYWPSHIDERSRNCLQIPLRTELVKRNSREILQDVINFSRPYGDLPYIYKGVVSHAALRRAMANGKMFHSMIPDVYATIAVAHMMDTFYYSYRPFAINGASGHSYGSARFSGASDTETRQSEQEFLSEENIPFHEDLVHVPSLPIIVTESFLQFYDHVSIEDPLEIDFSTVVYHAIKQARALDEAKRDEVINAVKQIAARQGIENELPAIIEKFPPKAIAPRLDESFRGINAFRRSASIDCTDFGVNNVYDAAVLCKHILTLWQQDYLSVRGILKTTAKFAMRRI